MTRFDVLERALELDPAEQELLLKDLSDRLYGEEGPPITNQWLTEIRRRASEIDSGAVTPVPAHEVHRRAREAVERVRSCK